jgi:biopolymer transport protein ExbD
MKKLAVISTLCLVIIAAILLYNQYSEYRYAKEAEAALTNMEANKPQRYKAEIPPEGLRNSAALEEVVVLVDDQGRLKLNSQEAGTIDDTSQLRAKLEQYFRERGDSHPGRTVFVRASSKLRYTEVKKVIDAAKSAGADPVGLQEADPE